MLILIQIGSSNHRRYYCRFDKLMGEKTASKKWVDYSDDESQEEQTQQKQQTEEKESSGHRKVQEKKTKERSLPPSSADIDRQLDKLDELDLAKIDEVWLLMTSSNLQYLEGEMEYLRSKSKKGGNIVNVFKSQAADAYDVKVFIEVAYDYIQKGYDQTHQIKVIVSDRNFQKNSRARGKQNDYKDSQRGKKKYVDKQTGLEPEVRKKQVAIEERKYTKEEVEEKGESLANFRSKPSKGPGQREIKEEVSPRKLEPKEQKQVAVKKESDKPAKERKPHTKNTGNGKIKSQNRFEGLQDLS